MIYQPISRHGIASKPVLSLEGHLHNQGSTTIYVLRYVYLTPCDFYFYFHRDVQQALNLHNGVILYHDYIVNTNSKQEG